ncbi:MAG: 23S rRNA (adenine(2503)-C(2))-methyltransferase RlmN [Gemmatimonadales bacterium]|nr:23S rRNA (adenine(2503)-C(2))-methyltransferase RlmN [Gemmatimonadales bacterium]
MKPLIRSLVPEEFSSLVEEFGQPAFRADQLVKWLHQPRVRQWDQMTNLSLGLRQSLAERYNLEGLTGVERLVSNDGTRKFLFQLRDGNTVESVIIPMSEHPTFCISCQVGCAMACRYCATARGGLVRNLVAGEVIEQILHLLADLESTPHPGMGNRSFNVVFMGMGEPLDNWQEVEKCLKILMDNQGWSVSRRRIQISTSGPRAGLEKLISADPGVGLTLSLGGSNDQERKRIMPVPGRTTLAEALELSAIYGRQSGRRVTLAWVLIAGSTDHPEQARRIVKLARTGPFKINLIPMNPLEGELEAAPAQEVALGFQKILMDGGIDTFIRASGGLDIAAACGQLRRKREKKNGERSSK